MTTDKVSFRSAGTECSGTVYFPGPSGNDLPVVLLCTGFSGTQDTPSIVAAAEALAEAGYAALTFDYRGFGTSGGEPRQVVDIKGQIADISAAIRFLRQYPGVDADRIVLWGTSLGGGHVVTAAAEDPRIAAVIAQVPFNGLPRKVAGRSARTTGAIMLAMAKDGVRALLGRPPHYIPVVGDADELAVMASREAKRTIEVMESATWQNRVAARSLIGMMRYKPGDVVERLRMPLLVCVAEHDRETVADDTLELAERAPRGELRTYPCAHFDIYRADIREKVLTDQLDFLRRALPS